jgi:hypothetical protein
VTRPALALLLAACSSSHTKHEDAAAPTPPKSADIAANAASAASVDRTVVLDFFKEDPTCSLGHRGSLIDFGTRSLRRVRVRGTRDAHVEAKPIEHGGATWLRVSARELSVPFPAPIDLQTEATPRPIAVSVRMQGGSARSASLYLNGKPVGAVRLSKGEITTASRKVNDITLKAAENEFSIRFNGLGRGGDVAADIDWARIGVYDDDSSYAAPTRSDALDTVRVKNDPKRALSLRAPGFARCSAYIPEGAKLTTALGLFGGTEADVELRLLRDREEPAVLATTHLTSDQAWQPVELELPGKASFAEVQLVVTHAAKGARVAFAEPKVSASERNIQQAPAMRGAKSVVLVVLGSVAPKQISAYGGAIEMPELGALAATGLVFDAHRATSNFAGASLASMITGLDVDQHGVLDAATRLPAGPTTLADCAREGGIQTAFFTANPWTSSAFGFDRGWTTFATSDPADLNNSTKVFDDASNWITEHRDGRFLLVLHARGGHPPWEASREELKDMPPIGYAGVIEARHAGEILSRVRSVHDTRFTDSDKVRMWALHSLALRQTDAGLGRLVATMRSLGRDEDTALIVTSDVSPDPSARVPFGEGDAPTEDSLQSVLMIRPPTGNMSEPARTSVMSSTIDVPTTVLAALGLPPPASFTGADLFRRGRAGERAPRMRYARSRDRHALLWGTLLLQGHSRGVTRFCDLGLEPTCAIDVRDSYPIAFARMMAATEEREGVTRFPREVAEPNAATMNALRIWGRPPRAGEN